MASTVRSHRANQGSIPCIGVYFFKSCEDILLMHLSLGVSFFFFFCYSVKCLQSCTGREVLGKHFQMRFMSKHNNDCESSQLETIK